MRLATTSLLHEDRLSSFFLNAVLGDSFSICWFSRRDFELFSLWLHCRCAHRGIFFFDLSVCKLSDGAKL